ncbi:MAG: FHA domain-containing protein, partial [Sphingomonadaceae bacterium]
MSAPYYVELLGANGEVLQRQRYQQLPIRIGRAYDNDLILDDAHSGAHHASVSLNERGELLMTDLGSQNGSIYRGHRISHLVLGGNTVVRLGHTRLRIRAADFPVAPEVPDTTMHGW